MLKRLYIENIAIIEKIEIEFMPGLCVLSGETGAGKSIIIDSINALTGSRVNRDIIRTGANSATVSAVFEGISERVSELALSMGVDLSDGEIVMRREMYVSGHNSCHINGQPATLNMLRQLGSLLINIHGQHDGLHLLNEELHIDYLDEYCNNKKLLDDYIAGYEKLLSLNKRIKALSLSESEKTKRLTLIEELITQLEEAHIVPDEWNDLTLRRSRLYSEEKLARVLCDTLSFLEGNDDVSGAYSNIASAKALMEKSKSISLDEKLTEKLSEALENVSQVTAQISDNLSRLEYTPGLLDMTEARLQKLENLANQCKCGPDELDKMLNSLYDEQSSLSTADESLDSLKIEYSREREALSDLSNKLHISRENGAERLSAQMESDLSFLNMPNARFAVEITPLSKFGKKGMDMVRFLLSANRGEDLKPLSKVASGGELSRIMLSFKNVLSDSDGGATAIFDEVDTGVSGKAASRVAHMLYSISRERQVLCVTHLPQIASAADYQYRISKSVIDNRTSTSVELLDENGRIDDLCRLIGGECITDSTRKSAAQMLEKTKFILTEDRK